MSVMRSLWASIQGDPVFMRRVNGWLTVFWIVMIPVSLITGWISSVTYVAALSLWALVSGHWSAWQAARVEVRQDEEAKRAEAQPVEQRVAETGRGNDRRTGHRKVAHLEQPRQCRTGPASNGVAHDAALDEDRGPKRRDWTVNGRSKSRQNTLGTRRSGVHRSGCVAARSYVSETAPGGTL